MSLKESAETDAMLSNVLVVDDEAGMRLMLATFLQQEGYKVKTATSVSEALALLEKYSFDMVVTDLSMPGGSGLDLLSGVKESHPGLPVIVMSAYGSSEAAISAMKAGAFDYVFKPFQPDEILFSLKKAEATIRLTHENELLRRVAGRDEDGGLVHKSRAMSDIMALIPKIAEADRIALVTGESGTGKELIARAIHRASPRRKGPFVAVNCGAIAESLLESELFGHLRGSFTGAQRNRDGLFRAADGGTLFLDEIGELPVPFQVKLLRAIQFSEVRPVGGEIPVKFDARIVAATSRDLEALVREHLFREDLYYRVNVLPVHLPPLRERKEDIPLLARHFADVLSTRLGRPSPELSDGFLEAMRRYDWPGNVRELENLMDRILVMAGERSSITIEDLPDKIKVMADEAGSEAGLDDLDLKNGIRKLEARYIKAALAKARGNRAEAARLLGLSYPSLLSKIKLYNISLPEDS